MLSYSKYLHSITFSNKPLVRSSKLLFFRDNKKNTFSLLNLLGFIPKYYIKKVNQDKISILFLHKAYFNFLRRNIISLTNKYYYFSQLKLKGLGFKLYKHMDGFYQLFLGVNNYVYLHNLNNIFTLQRGRLFFCLSSDQELLGTYNKRLMDLVVKSRRNYKVKGFVTIDNKLKYKKVV